MSVVDLLSAHQLLFSTQSQVSTHNITMNQHSLEPQSTHKGHTACKGLQAATNNHSVLYYKDCKGVR